MASIGPKNKENTGTSFLNLFGLSITYIHFLATLDAFLRSMYYATPVIHLQCVCPSRP